VLELLIVIAGVLVSSVVTVPIAVLKSTTSVVVPVYGTALLLPAEPK
jgi:hypothetical protein